MYVNTIEYWIVKIVSTLTRTKNRHKKANITGRQIILPFIKKRQLWLLVSIAS